MREEKFRQPAFGSSYRFTATRQDRIHSGKLYGRQYTSDGCTAPLRINSHPRCKAAIGLLPVRHKKALLANKKGFFSISDYSPR